MRLEDALPGAVSVRRRRNGRFRSKQGAVSEILVSLGDERFELAATRPHRCRAIAWCAASRSRARRCRCKPGSMSVRTVSERAAIGERLAALEELLRDAAVSTPERSESPLRRSRSRCAARRGVARAPAAGPHPARAAERLQAQPDARRRRSASDLSVAEFSLLAPPRRHTAHARDGLLDLPGRLAVGYYNQPTEIDRSRAPTTRAAGWRSAACSRRLSSPAPTPSSACGSSRAPTTGRPAPSSSSRSAPLCGCLTHCATRGSRCSRPDRSGVRAALQPGIRPIGIAAHTSVHYVPATWQTRRRCGGGMFGAGSGQPGAHRLHPGRLRRAREGDGATSPAGPRAGRRRSRRGQIGEHSRTHASIAAGSSARI